jgi:Proline dehydrogenase.
LVDAEQTYLQAFIDSLAIQYGDVINKHGPIVLNTFQCYLKSSQDRVKLEYERCKLMGVPFAAKFVRGAYMYEERRLAKENNYPDPIHDAIEHTHNSYDSNLREIIPKLSPKCHLLVASHNENSCQLAIDLIKQHNIKDQVSFAQLLGFADHITFSLAREVMNIVYFLNV